MTAAIDPLASARRDQRRWSVASGRLKTGLARWRVAALGLTIGGAAFVAASVHVAELSTIAGRAVALAGAAMLGVVPVIRTRRVGQDGVREWTRARSVSEALKKEIYLYLTRIGRYAGDDRDAELLTRRQEIVEKVGDLERHTRASDADDRPFPDVRDVASYVDLRVTPQIEGYYRPRAQALDERLSRFRKLEFGLALVAAALGAVAATVGDGLAPWVGVVTTAIAAVAAHIAGERYEYLVTTYLGTARRLEYLRDRWQLGAVRDAERFVAECEEAISSENEEWLAEWLSPAPAGAAAEP